MRTLVAVGLLVATVVLLVACGGSSEAPDQTSGKQESTPVSLRLNWQMKGEFTPFIVAVEKGYFQEQGLDVEVLEGKSATQALQVVGTGQDDFAYVPSIQLIKSVNEGMPVKATATVVKVDPMGMVSLPDVPLSTPQDLEGKKVEISAASTFNQIWPAFARTNGIDMSQVNVVRADPGSRFSLLFNGDVDVLADIFMTNEYPVLQAQADEELNTLRVNKWGFEIIGYTLVANETLLNEKPDVVRRFNAGARKGFRFTMDNPEEAASIASKAYPDALPENTTKGQVKQLVDYLKQGQPSELFVGGDQGWSQTLQTLKDSGAISEQKPLDEYYTNEFIPES